MHQYQRRGAEIQGALNHLANIDRGMVNGAFLLNFIGYQHIFPIKKQNPELLRSLVPEMLKSALKCAKKQKSVLLELSIADAHARLDGEATRLKELRKLNPNVQLQEIEIAETTIKRVVRHIADAHLRLDSVRLVLRS